MVAGNFSTRGVLSNNVSAKHSRDLYWTIVENMTPECLASISTYRDPYIAIVTAAIVTTLNIASREGTAGIDAICRVQGAGVPIVCAAWVAVQGAFHGKGKGGERDDEEGE